MSKVDIGEKAYSDSDRLWCLISMPVAARATRNYTCPVMDPFVKGNKDVARFYSLRESRPRTYVINIVGKYLMLHRASCWHFSFPGGIPNDMPAKMVSDDRRELEDWATGQGGKPFRVCSHCGLLATYPEAQKRGSLTAEAPSPA